MRTVCEYINYWLKGRDRHGVHSPFVYYFNDQCLSAPVLEEDLTIFRNYVEWLRKLIKEEQSVSSKKDTSHQFDYAGYLKKSLSSKKYLKLIFRIAKCYQPRRIVLFGDKSGLYAMMAKQGFNEASIHHIADANDDQPKIASFFRSEYQEHAWFDQLSFIQFSSTLKKDASFDLVFLDVGNIKQSIGKVLDALKLHMHDETIFLFQGIRKNNLSRQQWKKLVEEEDFNVTIDLYKMGMAIPRKHQAKEHFMIRY